MFIVFDNNYLIKHLSMLVSPDSFKSLFASSDNSNASFPISIPYGTVGRFGGTMLDFRL